MANPNSCTSTVACATGGSAAVTGHEAMAAFAQAQRALVHARRAQTATFGSLFLLAVAGSLWVSEVSVSKVVTGFPGLVAYVAGTLPVIRLESVRADMAEWYWGLGRWLTLLLDTLVIAFMGTLLGAAGAFVLGFPAARNLAPSIGVYSLARRCLEIARTVPELVYALMFVYAFGLGPLPGVLAIAIHSLGSLGKLFSEVAENIDPGPVEGVRAAGAKRGELHSHHDPRHSDGDRPGLESDPVAFHSGGHVSGSEAASGGLNSHLVPTPKYATITSHCGGPPAADAWSRHGYPACQSLQ